jgi:hypothetical protein
MEQSKRRPRTGEKRQRNLPLKIDRLPVEVRDAIQKLRNQRGKTWKEIEELSSLPYNAKWATEGGGFIDWDHLPTDVLELFPDLRLPSTNLQRWYDLRVGQVRAQIMAESAKAREWAKAFAGKDLAGSNAAVMNAMRDQVFSLMQKVGPGDQADFLEGLNLLSLTMARLQRVELQTKRVDADLARIDAERAKLAAEAGDPREIYLLASQDLLKKLRTREPVRAVIDPIKEELIQEFTHGAEAFAKQIEATAA